MRTVILDGPDRNGDHGLRLAPDGVTDFFPGQVIVAVGVFYDPALFLSGLYKTPGVRTTGLKD